MGGSGEWGLGRWKKGGIGLPTQRSCGGGGGDGSVVAGVLLLLLLVCCCFCLSLMSPKVRDFQKLQVDRGNKAFWTGKLAKRLKLWATTTKTINP